MNKFPKIRWFWNRVAKVHLIYLTWRFNNFDMPLNYNFTCFSFLLCILLKIQSFENKIYQFRMFYFRFIGTNNSTLFYFVSNYFRNPFFMFISAWDGTPVIFMYFLKWYMSLDHFRMVLIFSIEVWFYFIYIPQCFVLTGFRNIYHLINQDSASKSSRRPQNGWSECVKYYVIWVCKFNIISCWCNNSLSSIPRTRKSRGMETGRMF